MDDETRIAIASIAESVSTGFARMDRYFELQQAQYVAFRSEIRGELTEVRGELADLRSRLEVLNERVDRVETQVGGLRHEVRALQDWATRELADLRREIRTFESTTRSVHADVRRDLDQLRGRFDRLEKRLDDAHL